MTKATAPAFKFESIPAELRALPRWVMWKYEVRKDGKKTKPPYKIDGYRASHSDPTTWATFEEVQAAFATGKFDGVGFVLGDGFAGVDFDDVRDEATGVIHPAALQQIQKLDSYAETSVSGTGVHILVKGTLEGDGRKKPHVEAYADTRYFCVTGAHVPSTPLTINERETQLRAVWNNIAAIDESLTPTPPLIVTDKLKDLMHGEWRAHYVGVSEAVQGLLCLLAIKHSCDREKMDADFRESGLYADHSPTHADWIEKWERLSESELDTAIATVTKSQKPTLTLGEFLKPAVTGDDYDYIVAPEEGQWDGWLPRGSISMIGGSSGSMKSSIMFDLLRTQSEGKYFLGHRTFGLPFLVLMADRGKSENVRTLRRLKIHKDNFPLKAIEAGSVETTLREIKDAVESCPVTPACVFFEGADMILEDAAKMGLVAPFCKQLRKLAEHYHLAIVLSVGAPKSKAKDQYTAKRDMLFGSGAWGRSTETVLFLAFPQGDDMSDHRELSVLRRNAPPEAFNLVIQDGLLVEDTAVEEVTDEPKTDDLNAHILAKKDWFTIQQVVTATGKKYKPVRTRLNLLAQSNLLESKLADGKNLNMYRVVAKADAKADAKAEPKAATMVITAGGAQ